MSHTGPSSTKGYYSRRQKNVREKRNRLVLVGRAEDAMMDGEFDDHAATTIADAVSWLGVADVRAFGLTWNDWARSPAGCF